MSIPWNADIMIPHDSNYIVRCIEESWGPSRKGNPMYTLKFEIVTPETVDVAGEQVAIAGVTIPYYANTKTFDGDGSVNVEKTNNNYKTVFESKDPEKPSLFQMVGQTMDGIDIDNPPLIFKGKYFYAEVKPDTKEKRKSPTAEQLKKGIREGDIMLNYVTKKPIRTHYPKIVTLFGVAPEPSSNSSKPY